MLEDNVIVDGKVSRGLIGHMHVMPLVNQTDEGSAHRNHIVVRVRGEDEDFLWERCRLDRPCAVIGIRLSSRPAGDSVLEVVEYIDVDLVVRPVELQQLSERILQIVSLGKFQDRLVKSLAEPHDCLPDEFRAPPARTYQPRSHGPDKLGSGILFSIEGDVVVLLEI